MLDRRSPEGPCPNFAEGLREGIDEDDLVAQELGLENASQLTNVQERYKDKIKQKLQEQAAAAAAEKAAKQREFTLGKLAYGKGQYNSSVQLFTQALDKEGPFSPLGGEIQLWLALAYQATGREQDCIDLYKSLENTHPNSNIKKQAANLRFIMEAPKLKLGPDERVSIPVIDTNDRFVPERSFRTRAPPSRKTGQQREMTWEERFFAEYQPPQLIPNKYVLVASIILAVSLAWYSAAARQGGL
ncbi:g3534 [Coccomyxa elongata]